MYTLSPSWPSNCVGATPLPPFPAADECMQLVLSEWDGGGGRWPVALSPLRGWGAAYSLFPRIHSPPSPLPLPPPSLHHHHQLDCNFPSQRRGNMLSLLPFPLHRHPFPSILPLLLSILLPPVSPEKTLCERKLAQVPSTNMFYYQRTEAGSAVECAEKCVDDWAFCKSAILVEQAGAKSLCQLYGISFERLLPLNMPQMTPAQADPERLLPITLIELADPPCSSKFALNSQLPKLIGAAAKESLALMPRPSAQKKFARGHQQDQREEEKKMKGEEGEEGEEEWRREEGRHKTHNLSPNPASKFAEANRRQDEEEGEGEDAAFFRQHLPSPSFLPPTPIQPSFVSRGRVDPSQRCRNGFCPPRSSNAAVASYHSSQEETIPCAARKSTDPCAPQAHWLEWTPGSCSVTCGTGSRERRRYCSSGTQGDCPGEETDHEKCAMPACNQWTEWTEWGRCSTSCGGGKRTRQRMCRNGDKCPGPAVDSRSCNDQPCPSWTEWAEWGECSASCGRGIQRRARECVPKEGECGGKGSEYRECESRPCPSWGDWEPWSSCSKTCGGGESIRRRECHDGVADDCRGPAVEHLLCNTQPCPSWSPWCDWSPCSKSCGEGSVKTRRRECRYNGLPSDDCQGAEEDQTECRLGECPHWAEWTRWTDCSTSCGHGRQSRSRECRPNGFGCSGGDREVRFCQKAVCPYFDNWTEWGGCSVTCGRGFCERRRRCIKEGDLGKKVPPADGEGGEEEEEKEKKGEAENKSEQGDGGRSNKHGGNSLPEDITAADSLLPQTLQVAQSAATVAIDHRRRSPLISSKLMLRDDERGEGGGGGDCIGPEVDRKPCDAGPCCEWSPWAAWSNCRVRCGNSGFRDRSRSCEFEQNYNHPNGGGGQSAFSRSGFGASSSSVFAPPPFNNNGGGAHCPACIGESHQTESCTIPDDNARLCHDEKPAAGREMRARPKLRKEEDEEKGKGEEDEYGGGGDAPMGMMRDEAKREATKCHWGEWGKWTECGGKECRKKRSRECLGSKEGACECDGKREQVERCAEGEGKCGGRPEMGAEKGEEDCYWTEWSDWSLCEAKTIMRNRTRMCAGLRALANNCQCQGPLLEQMACVLPTTVEPTQLRTAAANSLIKRLQLTPRHRQSRTEKQREEERKEAAMNFAAPTIRRDEPEECGEWKEWGEWGECRGGGKCGGQEEGMRSRTRECKCKKGCAGIARESVSCRMGDC